jgi:hypothetical protein
MAVFFALNARENQGDGLALSLQMIPRVAYFNRLDHSYSAVSADAIFHDAAG